MPTSEITTVFDADNHYWEPSDAFTRHRDSRFADRGVLVREVDGQPRYVVHGELHPWIPGPGDVNPRPRPGALLDYFSGRGSKADVAEALTSEDPADHPEWFDRDARLRVMDDQSVEAVWMFPSHGVCMEGPMQPDVEAAVAVYRAFNRWLDDDWGFAYQDRILGVPFLTLSDLDSAIDELAWVLERGARVVAVRPGPAFTPEGLKSPADPIFDPFWARVAEAGIVVAAHGGFDDGFRDIEDAVARTWGYESRRRRGAASSLAFYEPFVDVLMHERRIHDFLAALLYHGLFERHPRLRFASIENGAIWVPSLLRALRRFESQGSAAGHDLVGQFHQHVWVAPYVEDDVADLVELVPVERILFGSDWPHAEGFARPTDFLGNVADLPPEAQRRIMVDNARELTFG